MDGLVACERNRRDIVARIQTLRDAVGDEGLTEEQRTLVDELSKQLTAVDSQLEHERQFTELSRRADADQEEAAPVALEKDSDSQFRARAQEFSIRRAVADRMGIAGSRIDAGLEREISGEIQRRSGRDYEGIAVPIEALHTRALSTTTPAAGPGARIVPDDYRPGDYIDLLRDALVTRQLGIRTLRGLSGDVEIPKAKSGATAGWATESGALSSEDLTFEAPVTMQPRKVGAIGQWSARMLLQASPDVEQLFRADFAAALAQAIDEVVVEGGGSHEPSGVLDKVSRTARTNSDPANGVAVAISEVYDLMETVDEANIGQGRRGFLLGFPLKYHAMQQVLFPSTDRTWWQNGQLVGGRAVVSNIAPTATRGSLTDAPTLIYGNWSDVILGYWQDLDVLVNPYATSAYAAGAVQIRIMAHADVAIRHDEAFGYLDGIIV